MKSNTQVTAIFLLAAVISPVVAFISAVTTTTLPSSSSSSQRYTTQLFVASAIAEQEANYLKRASNGNNRPEIVYSLVYNPYTEQEGVHTTTETESGEETLLLFESMEECNRFAALLAAEPSVPGQPVATPMPLAQMEQACQQMGWALKVVPE